MSTYVFTYGKRTWELDLDEKALDKFRELLAEGYARGGMIRVPTAATEPTYVGLPSGVEVYLAPKEKARARSF